MSEFVQRARRYASQPPLRLSPEQRQLVEMRRLLADAQVEKDEMARAARKAEQKAERDRTMARLIGRVAPAAAPPPPTVAQTTAVVVAAPGSVTGRVVKTGFNLMRNSLGILGGLILVIAGLIYKGLLPNLSAIEAYAGIPAYNADIPISTTTTESDSGGGSSGRALDKPSFIPPPRVEEKILEYKEFVLNSVQLLYPKQEKEARKAWNDALDDFRLVGGAAFKPPAKFPFPKTAVGERANIYLVAHNSLVINRP